MVPRAAQQPKRVRPRSNKNPAFSTGQLSPAELERARIEARAPGGPCHHDDVTTPCPKCGADLNESLYRACDGWRWLWEGTLGLLQRQEPDAYRRLLGAWGRHGLVGYAIPTRQIVLESEMGRFSLEEQAAIRHREEREARAPKSVEQKLGREFLSRDGRFRVAQLPSPPEGPAVWYQPDDALLEKYRAFRDDRRPVKRRQRVMPPAALVYQAFERARHNLREQRATRGDTLHARAIALIRERLFASYTEKSLEKLVKQGRRNHPGPFWDAFIDMLLLNLA
jgi:hypothetical protein